VTVIDGMGVLDADAHVIEPAHVFRDWQPSGTMPIDLPPDTPMVPCGDFDLLRDQFDHGFDAPSYLRAMDAQRIDAVVLYPSIGLFVPYLPHLSPKESAAACASYNEWVADYCATDPRRMAAVGLVPLADVDLAVEAAHSAAALGLVGVLARPNHVYGRNLGDPAYDPLWRACSELGLVVSVHEGLGLHGPTIGADRFDGFAARHALSHPMEQMAAMASLVLDGALERHELLRVAFLESGCGWLPYWLNRLDEHREWMQPGRPPATELFCRQCVISTEADDGCVAATIDLVGADHVLWASDFPHPDARFPDAAVTFLRTCDEQRLALGDVTNMLWETPLSFYLLADRFTSPVR
jgi:predicted TIM-barrel fold metal-dependent hydrolase